MRGPCLLLILSLVGFSGCSQDGDSADNAATTSGTESDPFKGIRGDLSTITLSYHNAIDVNRQCASIEDLKLVMPQTDENARRQLAAIESGEIVVRWGLTPPNSFGPDKGTMVIAYEADVPTNGGWVVLDDLTTVEWTAAEFQEKLGEQQQN